MATKSLCSKITGYRYIALHFRTMADQPHVLSDNYFHVLFLDFELSWFGLLKSLSGRSEPTCATKTSATITGNTSTTKVIGKSIKPELHLLLPK
jgi:hypothetical protein